MAWVRLDDQVPHNRKILRSGPSACWLWVCGLAHAQRQKSDGFIADEVIGMIGVSGATRCHRLATALVAAGLFERVEGGYQIHDYDHFNETAEEARERERHLSAARAKSGRAGGLRSAEMRRLNIEANKQNASNQPKQSSSPDPTRPDPTLNTPQPPSGGRVKRDEKKRAEEILKLRFGRCQHEPACGDRDGCLWAIVCELRAKAS